MIHLSLLGILLFAATTAATTSLEQKNPTTEGSSRQQPMDIEAFENLSNQMDLMMIGQGQKKLSNEQSMYFDYIFRTPETDTYTKRLLHRMKRDEGHGGPHGQPGGEDIVETVDEDKEDLSLQVQYDERGNLAYSPEEVIFHDDFDESPKGQLPWIRNYFEILDDLQAGCAFYENNPSKEYLDERIKYRGTAGEGEPCGYVNGSKNLTRCYLFEDDKCTEPTFFFCTFAHHRTNRSVRVCRKSTLVTELQKFRVFKHVHADTGCLKSYETFRDIPQQLQGDVVYKGTCNPAGLDHGSRCKWYTQAPIYRDNTNHLDKPNCLKPTHLYCDPLLQICLCGQDQDPNQFQYDRVNHKCYVRPTYDVAEGYECAPGTAPAKVVTGSKKLTICKCEEPFYAPHFNSTDPEWWKCSASSSPPYALLLVFVVFLTVGFQVKSPY